MFRSVIYGLSPNHFEQDKLNNTNKFSQSVGNNSGNILFSQAINSIICPRTYPRMWGRDLKDFKKQKNLCLIIPLANQLGPHTDLGNLAKLIKESECPVVGIGLGAQGTLENGVDFDGIKKGTWDFVKVLSENSPNKSKNIGLRGNLTFEILKRKNLEKKGIVTGCPSLFLNPRKNLGEIIRKKELTNNAKLVIAAGNPSSNLINLEKNLINKLEKNGGIYVCQHPIEMIALGLNFQTSDYKSYIEKTRKVFKNELSEIEFINWSKNFCWIYSDAFEWIRNMRKYDFVVGTRIHGIMAGLQAGVPSLCLYIDTRTKEICETMKVPHLNAIKLLKDFDFDYMINYVKEYNWDEFDYNRNVLAKNFKKFLQDNEISNANYLNGIID